MWYRVFHVFGFQRVKIDGFGDIEFMVIRFMGSQSIFLTSRFFAVFLIK